MEQSEERRKIAVDFDGTIVENEYPQIGREKPFALRTLRALQEHGFTLILWTCRAGSELEAAVEFCRKGGVEFYAVNENFEGELYQGPCPRKIDADIYIDDRNLGGMKQWGEIYHDLTGQSEDGLAQRTESKKHTIGNRLRKWILGK